MRKFNLVAALFELTNRDQYGYKQAVDKRVLVLKYRKRSKLWRRKVS